MTDEQKDSVNACKAMIFLAIFTTVGAIAIVLVVMFVMKDKQVLLFAAGGLDVAAGKNKLYIVFHLIFYNGLYSQ